MAISRNRAHIPTMADKHPKGQHNPSQKSLQRWDNEGGAIKGVRAKRPRDPGRSRLITLASARLRVHDVTDVAWAARRLENAKDGSLWPDWAVERCSLAPSLADMTKFVFDPPSPKARRHRAHTG